MRIVFVPVPTDHLPEGLHAVLVEGPTSVVYQLSREATLEQLCEALSSLTTEYAAAAWLHIGTLDLESAGAG